MKSRILTICLLGATFPIIANGQIISDVDPNAAQSAKAIRKTLNAPAGGIFTVIKNNEASPVKNQGNSNTCWAFSTTSMIESKVIKEKQIIPDVSEMFTVRHIYIEKAKNYVLRQGDARFSEGGLGHDLVHAISTYGAVPEGMYSGMTGKSTNHNHTSLFRALKNYLDSVIAVKTKRDEKYSKGNTNGWLTGFTKILDNHLGVPPKQFKYNGQTYTPETFATDLLGFKEDDYINITSFSHHPFYKPFILEVPDNFSNGAYYNLPMREMIETVESALKSGYTVLWDADVSNKGFNQQAGLALYTEDPIGVSGKDKINPDVDEKKWDADNRQGLFEDLITQDDHLMHITGLEKSPGGKTFFIVKNSWGNTGPFNGYVHVSESYFAINTISLVIPKAGIPQGIKSKLNIQ